MFEKPLFLVIDGSSMLTTAYYGTLPPSVKMAKGEEKESHYSEIMHAKNGTYTNAILNMSKTIIQLIATTKAKYVAIAFDESRNTFRKAIYPDYKGNRGITPVPLKSQMILMQQILKESGFMVLVDSRYEADDFAGSVACYAKKFASVRLITKDRDYLQLIDDKNDVRCWIPEELGKSAEMRLKYPLNKDSEKFLTGPVPVFLQKIVEFTESTVLSEKGVIAKQIPDLKGIEGDISDNIPGVKNVSSAAAPLIKHYGSLENIYEVIDSCTSSESETELKTFWKNELGIKRSPLKALKEQKEIALLSKNLAEIRSSLPLENVEERSDIKNIDADRFNEWMELLDIKLIRLRRV